MPRKTKEPKELENKNIKKEVQKGTIRSTSKTEKEAKKALAKNIAKKATTKSTKATTSVAKTSNKSTTKKSSTTKTSTKKTTKTSSKVKPSAKAITQKIETVEYYDLPYRYNQTVVKVLYQTPKTLFIYWDISDADRTAFEQQYGKDFFQSTRPILIVYNNTLGYSFEVEINDFANSWYLHVNDSKCDYRIELGRRPIVKTEKLNTDYIYVSISNEIESPNDHVLFNKEQNMAYFRNVKTGEQTKKSITSISFIRNIGKIYNIYDLYKAIYADENVEEIYDLSNPSSNMINKGEL